MFIYFYLAQIDIQYKGRVKNIILESKHCIVIEQLITVTICNNNDIRSAGLFLEKENTVKNETSPTILNH